MFTDGRAIRVNNEKEEMVASSKAGLHAEVQDRAVAPLVAPSAALKAKAVCVLIKVCNLLPGCPSRV